MVREDITNRRTTADPRPKDKALNPPRYRWTCLFAETFSFLNDAFFSFNDIDGYRRLGGGPYPLYCLLSLGD